MWNNDLIKEHIKNMNDPIIKGCIVRKELLEIQKKSFERFIQKDVSPDQIEDSGLQAAYNSIFPISDFNETAVLRFTEYSLGEPKYRIWECIERGMTFAVP